MNALNICLMAVALGGIVTGQEIFPQNPVLSNTILPISDDIPSASTDERGFIRPAMKTAIDAFETTTTSENSSSYIDLTTLDGSMSATDLTTPESTTSEDSTTFSESTTLESSTSFIDSTTSESTTSSIYSTASETSTSSHVSTTPDSSISSTDSTIPDISAYPLIRYLLPVR